MAKWTVVSSSSAKVDRIRAKVGRDCVEFGPSRPTASRVKPNLALEVGQNLTDIRAGLGRNDFGRNRAKAEAREIWRQSLATWTEAVQCSLGSGAKIVPEVGQSSASFAPNSMASGQNWPVNAWKSSESAVPPDPSCSRTHLRRPESGAACSSLRGAPEVTRPRCLTRLCVRPHPVASTLIRQALHPHPRRPNGPANRRSPKALRRPRIEGARDLGNGNGKEGNAKRSDGLSPAPLQAYRIGTTEHEARREKRSVLPPPLLVGKPVLVVPGPNSPNGAAGSTNSQ